MNNIQTIKIVNVSITERKNVKSENYYVIYDNDTKKAYFCFQNKIKENWQDLVKNYESIKEIEIEYEEQERGNKVIYIVHHDKSESIFV